MRQWIKLYLEVLNDAKMGRLSDHLWRRTVELFMMAGEHDRDGLLPAVEDMAWRLRTSVEQLTEDMQALQGMIENTPAGWFVTNFKKRQYSESYERVKRYRNGKSNGNSNADEAENSSLLFSSTSSSDSSSFLRGEGVGEGSVSVTVPATPRQAMANPYIQMYQAITGGFPGERDYAVIIDTFKLLEEKHGENYRDYLIPFWTAWSTRTNKDGQPYKKNSRVWYCEWAMQNEIPKANGHEPKMGETKVKSTNQDAIRKVAAHARAGR